jgi:hypothetical protein
VRCRYRAGVAGLSGEVLHGLLPSHVVDPAHTSVALVRVVLEPGNALIGRLVAAAIAHAGVLAIGSSRSAAAIEPDGWLRGAEYYWRSSLGELVRYSLSILS